MLLLALSLPANAAVARARPAVARLAGEAFIASPTPAATATAYGQEPAAVADGGAPFAKPAPFTQMELAALQGVSLSARKPAEYLLSWRESGVAPLGLLDVFGRPTTFASLLRSPQAKFYSTSKMPAAPMPPPMHIVTHTFFAPRRLPSISAWPVRRSPDTQ